ncbi:AMP-binding protein [Brevundimonas sp. NIBR11]|uniref:AMP-binding protein n=1 Tax=Brevundimonas sp. NIBR11 TaxID=3015999 RepID=UPI0022F03CF0|nr:AMP-binding protein [Brevundimonas sp. NIBR11]WGM31858.1 3-methylmercaptopropionyl-CoA ligase [Brevundimonas sp. NIBR11]
MQAYGLTVDRFLEHAAKWLGQASVVTAGIDGEDAVIGYAALRERANRLSGAFLEVGLAPGDRLATLAWNTQHHVEVWYGAMGVGMVCHTLNPRLTIAHLAAMITEADDRVLIVGQGLGAMGRDLMAACPCLERLILMDGDAVGDPAREIGIEALLAQSGRPAAWGGFSEEAPAGLCFTSGTTGAPKGVLYSHRANYLSTLRCLQADALALRGTDAVLVAVPMFHANAWGLPFAAAAVGATMVLPGRVTDGKSLARLINTHDVTVAMGVPTVWLGLIDHLDASGEETPTLERVVVGGSGIADALLKRIEDRLGATVQTSWGMTELSPMGTLSPPAREPGAARASGRAPVGLDMQLFDAAGVALPQQRNVVGHLKVKGHSVVERYYGHAETSVDADGWFDTGDLAIIDDEGNLTLSGRSKDLIKSGGEWINPAEMEDIVGALPSVGLVAVIGRVDAKWGERPVMVIEPRQGHAVNDNDVIAALKGRVADWWLPDRIVSVPSMPLAATGKINKMQLRATYGAA